MNNIIAKDFFTQEELVQIKSIIDQELAKREHVLWDIEIDKATYKEDIVKIQKEQLGRLTMNGLFFPDNILNKVIEYVNINSELDIVAELVSGGVTYAEYSGKYGNPRLQPHLDGGSCGIIFDYQLEANVEWPLGIEFDTVTISDNQGMMLYPTRQYHWRPLRPFSEDEFVKMIFFEFHTGDKPLPRNHEKEMTLHNFADNFYKEKE